MIIGLTGRIAAGKETLTSFLREKGFVYLETSKLLNEELAKRGVEITRTNQQNLGDELRKKLGPGVLMKMFLEKMCPDVKNVQKIHISEHPENQNKSQGFLDKNYIIDSLRNHHEAAFLKNCGIKFFLIAVDAPREIRFERIIKRAKPSDPKTWPEFLEIDNRDFDSGDAMGQNVKKCFEVADFIIMNDDNLEDSMKRIVEVFKEIESKQ